MKNWLMFCLVVSVFVFSLSLTLARAQSGNPPSDLTSGKAQAEEVDFLVSSYKSMIQKKIEMLESLQSYVESMPTVASEDGEKSKNQEIVSAIGQVVTVVRDRLDSAVKNADTKELLKILTEAHQHYTDLSHLVVSLESSRK